MGQIVVIAFDNPDDAGQLAKTLRDLQKAGAVHLDDMRVVVKDGEGKVQVRDEAGHPVAWAAVAGGVLGGLLFILIPVVGAVAGAAVGAVIAKTMDLDVDKKFIQDVSAALQPNTSALFVLGRAENQAALLNALKPYKGTLIQTSVDSDAEAQLKRVLSDHE